ncbi:hypothetical protein EW146_g9846, partial [Bondarzewia mesenterica]
MSDPSSSSSSSSSFSPPSTPPNLHQNSIDPAAKWLVQKYGGTSVGKFAAKIAQDIVPDYLDQHKLAIVCSARSGSTKALGTTNLLLRAASEALQQQPRQPSSSTTPTTPGTATPFTASLFRRDRDPSSSSALQSPRSGSPPSLSNSLTLSLAMTASEQHPFSATVDVIRDEHLTAAKKAVKDESVLEELEAEIERDCECLRAFLYATQVIDEISPRSRDSIVGFGEKLGCKIIAAALRDQGIDAEYVSLENVVPAHDDADNASLDQSFYDGVATAFADRIRQCVPASPSSP